MAVDAVTAPPPPPAKAAAPAAPADTGASQSANAAPQSPFGALMAMLEGSQTPQSGPTASSPAQGVPASASQTPAGQTQPGQTQPGQTQPGQTPASQTQSGQAETGQAQTGPLQTGSAQTAPVQAGQTPAASANAGKTAAKDDDQDDSDPKTGEAAPVDPAALLASLLVPQPAQTVTQGGDPQAATAAADSKAAPTVQAPTPQLAAADANADPKLAGAAPPAAKADGALTGTATPQAQAAVAGQAAAPAADRKPTIGDLRRAEARTGDTRDPNAVTARAQQQQQASRDAGNQADDHAGGRAGEQAAGGQAGGDPSQGPSSASNASAPAVVEGASATATVTTEMAAQIAAPDSAAPLAANALAAGPQTQFAAQSAAIVAQAAASPVRGSPETVAHLAAQMIQRLDGQNTQFDLALNPQNLGRVDVRIEIDRHGTLKARMAFDSPEAAKQLSGSQGDLRSALQSAGFDVAEGALSFDVSSGGQQQQGGAFEGRDATPGRMFQAVAEAADPLPAHPSYFTRAAASGVDIRI